MATIGDERPADNEDLVLNQKLAKSARNHAKSTKKMSNPRNGLEIPGGFTIRQEMAFALLMLLSCNDKFSVKNTDLSTNTAVHIAPILCT